MWRHPVRGCSDRQKRFQMVPGPYRSRIMLIPQICLPLRAKIIALRTRHLSDTSVRPADQIIIVRGPDGGVGSLSNSFQEALAQFFGLWQ
jgi:hypothetical protein